MKKSHEGCSGVKDHSARDCSFSSQRIKKKKKAQQDQTYFDQTLAKENLNDFLDDGQ